MEKIIDLALAAIPDKFRTQLANLAFVVEDRPPAYLYDDPPDGEDPSDLLGLYEGVPLNERTLDMSGALPDRILLFRENILAEATDAGGEPTDVLCETVWHEVAHFFGFDEDKAEALCDKWFENFDRLRETGDS